MKPPPVRLFVAIDLDESARRAIAVTQQRVVKALAPNRSIKLVDSAHMHLTLVFLGEVDSSAVPAIVDTLTASIEVPPFAAEFQGLGVFPPHGAPRVLWLGVGEGAKQIVDVQREVASRLVRLGVALEARPFHPHLTLARWKISRPADRPGTLAIETDTPVARVAINLATLYQSRLSAAGPTYTALTRANLT
jgi:2'-5' RNA ligase